MRALRIAAINVLDGSWATDNRLGSFFGCADFFSGIPWGGRIFAWESEKMPMAIQ